VDGNANLVSLLGGGRSLSFFTSIPSRRVQGAWRTYGNNEIERDGRLLRVVGVGGHDADNGAFTFLNASSALKADLIPGMQYRLDVTAKASVNGRPNVAVWGMDGRGTPLTSSLETHTFEFIAKWPREHFVYFPGLTKGDAIWIEGIQLYSLSSGTRLELAGRHTPGISQVPLPDGDPAANNPIDAAIAASTWPRIAAIKYAIDQVAPRFGTALFGFGIGSHTFARDEVATAGSEILFVSPVGRRVFETGAVGVLLYWILVVATVIPSTPLEQVRGRSWRALALAFRGVVALFIIGELYTETQMDAPSLMFWLLAAGVVGHSSRLRHGPEVTVSGS
jgi:hypothetical protein